MTSRESAAGPSGQFVRVRRVLTGRFLSEGLVAEVTHLLLPVALVGTLWGTVSNAFLGIWIGMIFGVTAARGILRMRAARGAGQRERVPTPLRLVVVAAGLTWGVGTMLVASRVSISELALLMVLLCGLAAGATTTLIADPEVFYGFLGAILGPLAIGILLSGDDHFRAMASVLVAIFGGTMAMLYQRARVTLLDYLSTADTLEQNTATERAERLRAERRFAVRNAVAQVLAEATIDRKVLPEILRAMAEQLRWDAGAAWRVAPGTNELRCQDVWSGSGVDSGDFLEITRGTVLGLESSWIGRACTSRHHVWIADASTAVEGARAAAAVSAGIHTAVVVPLRDGPTLIGAIELYRKELHDPDPETMAVFGALGSQVATAIGRRRAEVALHAAEAQNRRLIETASDMIWRVDPEGRWTFVNRAAEQIYKMSPESLLGHYMLERCDPRSRETDRAAFARVLEGEDLRDHESVHLDADGVAHTLSTSVRPMRDPDGRIVAVEGIARDVTERVAAREALRDARDAAERATATKSAFLANMSHEIRTPMNGILGMTELLLDSPLTQDQQRYAELISTSGENLLAIINDILDLSKIEAGQLDLEATEFDLRALVEGLGKLFTLAAAERGVELINDVPDLVPRRVVGDPTRLRQVLTNLVGNAVKFTHDGEVVITVRPIDAAGVARLQFVVRDSGIGIAPAAAAAIFEPFRQADATTTRKYGGTGLGLSISRHLVEMMGGRLEVESTLGVGSEFHFTLTLPVATTPEVPDATPADLREERILLVDDNAVNRHVLRGMLARAGCIIDEASGGREALDALRQAASRQLPYRILISDVRMPEMDGFELAAAVRADAALQRMRIMLLASAEGRGDAHRCDELGVGAYLLKPIARDELIHAIGVALGTEAAPLVTRASIRRARRSLRVLLAEDNVVNQEVAAMMLRRRGHTVDVVNNGRQAVDAVQRRPYDVVLMDMQMPEMDGLQATRAIRALPTGGTIPIIALTASAIAGERERCVSAGMDDYLSKPFKPLDLFAIVEGTVASDDSARPQRPDPEFDDRSIPRGPTPTKESPPVDLAGFRADLEGAGVEEVMDELLSLFAADAPIRLAALEASHLNPVPEEIARTAHAFKSAAAAIRATRLCEMLEALERAGQASNGAAAAALMPAIRAECEVTLRYIADSVSEVVLARSDAT